MVPGPTVSPESTDSGSQSSRCPVLLAPCAPVAQCFQYPVLSVHSDRTPAPVSGPQLLVLHTSTGTPGSSISTPAPGPFLQPRTTSLPQPGPISVGSPTELVTGAPIAAAAEVTPSIIEWQQGSTQDCLPLPAWSVGTGRCHSHCPILLPWLGTPNSSGCGDQGVGTRV